MRIGVNGWRLSGWTGVPRYLNSILPHWNDALVAAGGHEVTVYTAQADAPIGSAGESVRREVLPSRLPMLVWENTLLARRSRDDVLWCPGYTRPLVVRPRTVVTTHDLGPALYPDLYPARAWWFDRHLHRWSARNACLVITDNENTREDIARHYGVSRERIRVIPFAPASAFRFHGDPERATRTRIELFGEDRPFFLNVGTQSKRRNVPRILAAFAQFKKEGRHPHRLMLVGKGSPETDLAVQAQSLGIANDVVHFPFVDDARLNEFYNAATAFVLAATYDATSLTVLESQVCGAPVLIPNVPGLRAVAGDHALVYGPPVESVIAEAMDRIVTDRPLWAALAQSARRHAEALSWRRTAAAIFGCLTEAACA